MESNSSISTALDGHSDGVQRIRPLNGRTTGPTRRSTKGQWTAEEDEMLRKAVQRFKGKNWKKIAECFKDRTDVQCLHRWQKVLNPELVKGPWSKEEDENIIELVNKYGPKKWSTIAQHLPGRIGKQCRERWHNHLNPAINKEAWTQQEELALIRAHQIYGNRWAELTKFLPGRSDNSIKNHWNSSVKKKLDSYLASGLLDQLQALPLVGPQNQSLPSSSSRLQSKGDDNSLKYGTEVEEISVCSQESNVVGCSQSASDMGNAVSYTRGDIFLIEESGFGKEQSSSPVSCSEQYYTYFGDVNTYSIPETHCEVGCPSNVLQQNSLHDNIASASRDYHFDLHEFPDTCSVDIREDSSALQSNSIGANEINELLNAPFQTCMGIITGSSAKSDCMLISDEESCRILFSEAMNDEFFLSELMAKGSNRCTDSLLHPSSNCQVSEAERASASESYGPSRTGVLGTSCNQLLPPASLLISADDSSLISREPNQLIVRSFETHEQEFVMGVHDGFIYTNDAANTPCDDGTDNTELQEQPYLKEPSKLVPVNSFTSGSDTVESCLVDEAPNVHLEEQDRGALCYEPPRFPSLDIPFLSCDLIQSGSVTQQEYSPLGIRQLMMSSMNCISPFRLWDSPRRDDSPDAVLRNAAMTFTSTPSILKKRNRDLLSPLSDVKGDKKLEIDMASNLTKEFSRLDVMFDGRETQKASAISPSDRERNSGTSCEDKENLDPVHEAGAGKERNSSAFAEAIRKDSGRSDSKDNMKQEGADADVNTKGLLDDCSQIVLSGVHAEGKNSLLFSPDQVSLKADRPFGPSSRTPRNSYRKIFGTLYEQAVSSPPVCRQNHENHLVAVTSVQTISAPAGKMIDNTGNDAGIESSNIFGETPLKRSIESPSAWKSPWFINSFLSGPRIDNEISIEDIGYFMSPGDRSYDAITLMKQLSEHTASAYADALEVLGNGTPRTISKSSSNDHNVDQQNNRSPGNHLENHPKLASNKSTECRTLDFSECGTPEKGADSGKSVSAISVSSSTSYLLKGCR